MHLQSDICIIGNGAVGKAAALGFAQAGLGVTLVGHAAPAAAVADWDLRVYALNHVAHALLSSLRVWDALDAARVAPVDAMQVYGDGAQAAGSHAGQLGFDAYGARVGALAWIVEDSNLNQALDAALKFAAKVRCVQASATAIETAGAAAQVALDNGDTIGAELLVGADGGQSWVRGQCEIGIDYRSYGQRAVVANFECAHPHRGVAHQWFAGEQGIVALLPLPGQRVSLVWSAPENLAEALLHETPQQLAQRLAVWAAPVLGDLRPLPPPERKAFPLALIRPHAIVAPRVALVGDAAHVIHPLAGHGMNLGFADVAALLTQVAGRGPQVDCGDARVLRRYARARKEDILAMQMTTDGLARLFGSEFEPVRKMRNLGLNLLDRIPALKRRLISHALGRLP
ncbi:MAG: FAD-dependent monooxygenase [Burkholderiaceae bacterium]|nr:FAD-dependent monooxygenase [Burkholderiaceae bacterium]